MTKRVLGASLWFAAIWFGFEVLWSVAGIPRVAGPILGGVMAILVTLDPTGGFWGRLNEGPRQISRRLEIPS